MGIFDWINRAFGYILYWGYVLFKDYGLAIILFTLVTRILLFPLGMKQQKGMLKMAKFQPKVQALQKKYANNKQKLQEETMKLYQEEGYSPMGGCLPLLIQMPILLILYNVVSKPLSFVLGVGADKIEQATKLLGEVSASTRVEIELIKQAATNPAIAKALDSPGVADFHYNLFGIPGFSLLDTPSIHQPSLLWLVPILAAGFSLLSSWYSTHKNKAMQQPGAPGMGKFMMILPAAMSLWIAFTVPAALGVYWIATSALMMLQTFILYKMYDPTEIVRQAQEEAAAMTVKKRKAKKTQAQRLAEARERERMYDPSYTEGEEEAQEDKKTGGKSASKKAKAAPETEEDGEITPEGKQKSEEAEESKEAAQSSENKEDGFIKD
jgi:YidC/Oxa1 family membrane protein insertase